MYFNPNRILPAHEVVFSRRTKGIIYPNLYFNKVLIVKTTSPKHLGRNLDARVTFNHQINEKIGKTMKVGVLRKLQWFLPRSSLLTIYEFLMDYKDIIFD